jgi:hypothetical protein
MSDNEQTLAPLCQTGILSIKASPREAIPEFAQAPEEGTQIPSFAGGTDAGHVFPNEPTGLIALSDAAKAEGEVRTVVIHALAEPGDGEALAGRSSNENIETCIGPILKARDVAEVRRGRIVMAQDGTRELVDLRIKSSAPAERLPRYGRG